MRVVVQRVLNAAVHVGGALRAEIGIGLLVLLGIEDRDGLADIDWLCAKIAQLRIFDDHEAVPNRSLCDVGGEALVVSQFTLYASTKKGNRPSYSRAAKPEIALPLYEAFVAALQTRLQTPVATGTFGANMQVSLTNDGPITIIMDSHQKDF
jgi:D-aminoacyl-tRNA deacylase